MARCSLPNSSWRSRVLRALLMLIVIGLLQVGLKLAWYSLKDYSRTVAKESLLSEQRRGEPALARSMGR